MSNESFPDEQVFKVHADFCTVMSNEKRLRILWMLGNGDELTVGEIARRLDTSMANASQHLRVMRSQSAVISRKVGQQVLYRIANSKFFEGCQKVHEGLVELQLIKTEALSRERPVAEKESPPQEGANKIHADS